MSTLRAVPFWAGRSIALLGILLVALSLRTAVTTVSPIVTAISEDIPLDTLGLGVIGIVPPIAFALSGLFGAAGASRFGLERFLVVAIAAMAAGHLVRGMSANFPMLLSGTILALAGAGIGNILLPALVKRYFSDRIGLLTSLYVTIITVGSMLPPLVAVPITDAVGWRPSFVLWSVVATIALLPWLLLLLRDRRRAFTGASEQLTEPRTSSDILGRIWHSRTAWSISMVFGVSSLNGYAMFAWLPLILTETAGMGDTEAATFLSLYAALGFPTALLVPLIAARVRNVSLLVYLGVACITTGNLGLLIFPSVLTWLWVGLAGSASILFATSLVLINLRTRSHRTSAAVSGFVQGVGYTIAAVGALLFALLYDTTGGWAMPLVLLVAVAIGCLVPGFLLRGNSYVEDDLHGGVPFRPRWPDGEPARQRR